MRYSLFILVLMLTIGRVDAQKFGFAAETGITAGRFSDNQFQRRFTYHMGVNTNTTISSNVHLNLGLGYVRKGSSTNVTGSLTGPSNSINLDYLELGLMVGLGEERLQFRFGPTYSYLVQANISSGSNDINISDLVNDRELGVKAGIFFKFWEAESAYFSINYYQGLEDTNFDPEERLTTNYFQLTLGYVLLANK